MFAGAADEQMEEDIATAAARASGVPEADVPTVVRHRVKKAEMSTQATARGTHQIGRDSTWDVHWECCERATMPQ